MRFLSINKLVDEIKTFTNDVDVIELLLNTKLFKEDKYKNMTGPILMMRIKKTDGKVESIPYLQIMEKFGEDIRIKMNFPAENKCQFLICSINAEESHSQFGSFHTRTFSKVGYMTQKAAQKLTQDFEKNKERIGDAIEMVENGEDL